MASGGPAVVPPIPGPTVAICHAGAATDRNTDPATPAHHDCCDACALCAAAALPVPTDLSAPARVIHRVAHAVAPGWAPVLGRPRTPRLAQGPPAA